MHRESLSNPGVMAAVMGMGIDTVERIVSDARGNDVLAIANHNHAEQISITGEQEPLARAEDLIKEEGGKVIRLKVSGAWHCSLMANAVGEFRQFMADISFSRPDARVLFNATADYEEDPEYCDITTKVYDNYLKGRQTSVAEGIKQAAWKRRFLG